MIPTNEPRFTAYTLGEMSEDERRAFEAELMKDDDAQRFAAELAGAAELLRGELAKDAPDGLAERQRTRIEHAAQREQLSANEPSDSNAAAQKQPVQPPPSAQLATVTPIRRSWLGSAGLVAGALVAAAAVGLFFVNSERSMKDEESASESKAMGSSVAKRSRADRDYAEATGTAMAMAYASASPMSTSTAAMSKDKKEQAGAYAKLPPTMPSTTPLPENPFVDTVSDVKSTFSIDVDTASYAIMRRMIQGGSKPSADLVRVEEMINYFHYAYPEPDDAAFSVTADATGTPWAAGHRLVRIGLKGKNVDMAKRPASNLVFLIDTSGSMDGEDRIELLKKGFKMLVEQLDERDTVSIVTYAGSAGLVLEPTRGTDKGTILAALDRLKAGGSTNGSGGIQLAYATAKAGFIEGGSNRVILASDGDFNVGISNRSELTSLIEEKAKTGVYLSVLGFGTGNTRDATMETLADKGNGNYSYIDSEAEARKVLVSQAAGTLNTIAKDVKIQISFDPKTVQSFRLIGYENRVLAHSDFEDDKKDAGDIGAGHTVTALYEVVVKGNPAGQTHLADVALRYKQPDGDTSRLVETTVVDSGAAFADASSDMRFAASVAGFGMLLRGSSHKGDWSYASVLETAKGAVGDDADGYRREFVGLVEQAQKIAR